MKVLLVNGAPHEKGCTYTALCEIAKELNNEGVETEIFWLGNKPVRGCIGCGGCANNGGKCVFNDDVANILIEKAEGADGFIFGSPVHYAAASGNLTAFMDRVFYSGGGSFRHKPVSALQFIMPHLPALYVPCLTERFMQALLFSVISRVLQF